ncbi:MAG: phenylalanine--tRNA ligase subunit alpha [Candidatus Zixiibacteriota bacterium]
MSNKKNDIDVLARLDEILEEGKSLIENAASANDLEQVKSKILGRKGSLSDIMKMLGKLPKELRPQVGKKANQIRGQLQKLFDEKKKAAPKKRKGPDLTLPGKSFSAKGHHPYHSALREIIEIWLSMGFEIADGPDVDTIFNNFDALNTPEEHPSRNYEDTFYMNEDDLVMRTHTSPVQIRTMKANDPPVKIIAPGRCYRRDTVDATHYFSFTQVEGLYIDKNVNMAHLKGVLTTFARRILGPKAQIRFRPHFFPFTEPSVEYDFSCNCRGKDPNCRICKGSGWIEISGAGMVDPNVIKAVGYDPEKYMGYAFGMGVERIVMIKHNLQDIRQLYENDLSMLAQF